MKKVFGGIFDGMNFFFLAGSKWLREKLRSGVDDLIETSFEFKRMPKKDVGFVAGDNVVVFEFFKISATNEPSHGSDK